MLDVDAKALAQWMEGVRQRMEAIENTVNRLEERIAELENKPQPKPRTRKNT